MADDNDTGSFLDPVSTTAETTGDSFSETSHQSFFARLWESIVGVGIGLLLIVGCTVGIFYNEKSSVDTYRSLAEGQSLVVTVPSARIDPANNGKLIHSTGTLSSQTVADSDFGVSAAAVTLVRHVEAYQWKQEEHSETKKNLGGSSDTVKTYSYSRVWSDKAIDSSRFRNPNGHGNPAMRFSGRTILAQGVTLGAYQMNDTLLRQLGEGARLPLKDDLLPTLKSKLGAKTSLSDDTIYIGANPTDPQIGDMRVSYSAVAPEPASVVGVQSGLSLSAFQAHAGDQLLMMRPGILAADQMFKAAAEDNRILHWILRAVITIIMFIGWALFFRPFVILADIIPIFGSIIGFGTMAGALLMTLLTVPILTAIAWFAFRPLVSLSVIAGGAALFFLVRRVLPRKIVASPARMAPA